MLRLFRGIVAESLGIGGLIWLAMQVGGTDGVEIEGTPVRISAGRYSAAVTLQKPAIAAVQEAPQVAMPPDTFFRGTDSLLGSGTR